MSVTLPTIDTTGKVVGSTGQIPLKTDATNWSVPGHSGEPATVRILNESGCGLKIWTDTNQINAFMGAGAWQDLELEQGTLYLNFLVMYTIPNPPANMILVTFHSPGEKVPVMATLGNSPIGGGTSTTTVGNTLSNEANATPAIIIDIGQVANTNLINVFSDGSFTWNIVIGGVVHNLLKGQIAGDGNPLLLGAIGDIVEFLGSAQVNGNLTVAGSSGLVVSSGPIQTTGVGQNIQASGQLNSVAGIISLHSHNCLDFSGANFSLLVPTGANIQAQVNGSAKLVIDSSNVTISAGLLANNGATISGGSFSVSTGASFTSGLTVSGNSLFLTQGSIKRTTHGSFTSNGSVSQTVAHGMTTDTPDEVIVWCSGSTSTATGSVVSVGATTFVFSCPSSISWHFEARKY